MNGFPVCGVHLAGMCPETADLRADIARVTADYDEARADLSHEREGHQNAVDNWNKVAAERDAMRAVVDAADDFAGVSDADIHPAALPLKRRLLAALAALDGAR